MELYLLSGDEQYEKEKWLQGIKDRYGELKKGFNYILIDKDNINSLEQELSTYSFFSPDKLIIVKVPKKNRGDSDDKEWLTNDLLKLLSEDLGNITVVFEEDGNSKGKLFNAIQ